MDVVLFMSGLYPCVWHAMYICESYTPFSRVCPWGRTPTSDTEDSSLLCAIHPRKRRLIPNVQLPTMHDVMDDLLNRCQDRKIFLEYEEGEYIRIQGDEELFLAIELSVLYFVKHHTDETFDRFEDGMNANDDDETGTEGDT